jgi:putative ABC transport system substrate-binding protein
VRRRDFVTLLGNAAVVMPLAASAQQKAMPVIGYLAGLSPGPSAALLAAFRQGLSDTGYVEGRDVAIEYRWRTVIMTGCPPWQPISWAARSI